MQRRHGDRARTFAEQVRVTERHVIPFLEAAMPLGRVSAVLEIGCGEGGNLRPFLDRGCRCVGVDLAAERVGAGLRMMGDHPRRERLSLLVDDVGRVGSLGERFDLVLARDVLEHLPDHGALLRHLGTVLAPGGAVFLSFPPWRNPFGGHQQICQNPLLSRTPWIHLLPAPLLAGVLRLGGEAPPTVDHLLDLRRTGVATLALERLLEREGYRILRRRLYLVNPAYREKFGLTPREAWPLVDRFPRLRDLVVTAGYYLVAPRVAEKER
jgi:SAM-dependent methyltransferase